jgi:outer membrane immunogenic protein
MKRTSLILASALMFAAPVAQAADMPLKAPPPPPPPPAYTWTGCYVGAGVGYGMWDDSTQQFIGNPLFTINPGLDQSGKGWLGRVGGGCDYQFGLGTLGNFVVGALVDYDFAHMHGKFTGDGTLVGLVSGDRNMPWEWAAGGRIGYLVTPSLLSFVSGGWTEAKFNQVIFATITPGVLTGVSAPGATYNGWFLGGGLEYGFNWLPGLFLKTEYRFSDFRSRNLAEFVSTTGALTSTNIGTHPTVQTVTTELVYRFNWFGH